MKKYNKKRNPAFIMKSVCMACSGDDRDDSTKRELTKILKEHFNPSSESYKFLKVYNYFLDFKSDSEEETRAFLEECREIYNSLDKRKMFNEQTTFLSKISNKDPDVFNSFVKDYRILANLHNYFESNYKPGEKEALRESIVQYVANNNKEDLVEHVDEISYKIFVDKYNEKYGKALSDEQKEVIKHYVSSLDQESQQRYFVREHSRFISKTLSESFDVEEISKDPEMRSTLEKVIEKIDNLPSEEINEETFITLMSGYDLIKEMK